MTTLTTVKFTIYCIHWLQLCSVIALIVSCISCAPTTTPSFNSTNTTSEPPRPRADLLRDLARAFGIKRIPAQLRRRTPPLYFQRLFDSMTLADGQAGGPPPFQADTIVGYPDKATSEVTFFRYDVTTLGTGNELKNAELHLFRMRRRPHSRTKRFVDGQLIEMKLYQVTHPSRNHTHYGNLLIDARVVSKSHHGWLVFNVAQAVRDWLQNRGGTNYGFLVVSRYRKSLAPVENGTVYFAQRGQHHDRLQPSLALYTAQQHHSKDDQQATLKSTPLSLAFRNADPLLYDNIYRNAYSLRHDEQGKKKTRRKRGALDVDAALKQKIRNRVGNVDKGASAHRSGSNTRSTLCRRYSLYVDFRTVGWDEWIISPRGFNAYHCRGLCPFPLGQQLNPSNHAVVQSIVNALSVLEGVNPKNVDGFVQEPCCVPNGLGNMNLLYYDDQERVVLKQYDGMRALSCACR